MADTNQNMLLENVKTNKITYARELLERGADPNYINSEEAVSPMHLAAGIGVEPLCLLLQYNGDPNITLNDGTTPVHVAVIWGMCDCVQILLANGGDPYIRDKEGLSAEDMAIKYQHDDVLQVIQQYAFQHNSDDDQTSTPMFTYKRLSMDSLRSDSSSPTDLDRNISDTSTGPECEDSMFNTQRLADYLHEFARRRRSSLFLNDVQRQVDRYFGNGQKTHLVDVTSPDHPYIEERSSSPEEYSHSIRQDSLHLNLSASDTSDSFVTCDGESINSDVLRRDSLSSPDVSPYYNHTVNTIIKNPKITQDKESRKSPFVHRQLFQEVETLKEQNSWSEKQHRNRNYCPETDSQRHISMSDDSLQLDCSCNERSRRRRGAKYCVRELPSGTKSLSSVKCDFCGGLAEKEFVDGTVCASCEKLGLELDELVGATIDDNNSAIFKHGLHASNEMTDVADYRTGSLPDLLETLPKLVNITDNNGKKKNWLLAERNKVYERDKGSKLCENNPLNIKSTRQNVKIHENRGHQSNLFLNDRNIESQSRNTSTSNDVSALTSQFDKAHINHAREGNPRNMCKKQNAFNQVRLDDSVVSHISSTVNELDNAQLFTDFETTLDETFLNKVEMVPLRKTPKMSLDRGIVKEHEHSKEIDKSSQRVEETKGGIDDLWKEIRECKQEKLAQTAPRGNDLLDTGFCGHQSMSSMFSSASTVDYVYTDKQNGITLVERHLPSLCGSQGSRRSIDSQGSAKSNEVVNSETGLTVHKGKSNRSSFSSDDTVLYNWRENAMIRTNDSKKDSIKGCSDNSSCVPKSKDKKLDDKALHSKLSQHGDAPGPITNTTRQTYLTRLDKLEKNKTCKKTTVKAPDYPPELQLALNGYLDMSDMPGVETKMVAAFQNPDRLRRWREGTLKSSFNYILLDPRVTKNLPNRALNMSDQDIFQTFISAIFYIGKGKRARPYCHLYEAIKQQDKNNVKMSKKVEKIIDIWTSGMGVVSLHCYQSVIPVEAYTREACMIDAIGLKELTNQKKGDYYGVSVTFSMKERRKIGVFLLQKALQIFLAEGERQIAPLDIKKS